MDGWWWARHQSASCHIQKFSDDSAVVDYIMNGNNSEHQDTPTKTSEHPGTVYLGRCHLQLPWCSQQGPERKLLVKVFGLFGLFFDSVLVSAILYEIIHWSKSITAAEKIF